MSPICLLSDPDPDPEKMKTKGEFDCCYQCDHLSTAKKKNDHLMCDNFCAR